jgi:hypothetical protein
MTGRHIFFWSTRQKPIHASRKINGSSSWIQMQFCFTFLHNFLAMSSWWQVDTDSKFNISDFYNNCEILQISFWLYRWEQVRKRRCGAGLPDDRLTLTRNSISVIRCGAGQIAGGRDCLSGVSDSLWWEARSGIRPGSLYLRADASPSLSPRSP